METTLHEDALKVIQENLKDGDYLKENFKVIGTLHHHESSNPVYKVTRIDNVKQRAVKEVRLQFNERLSCDTSSTLTVQDGIAVTNFLKCIQECILVQNKFSSHRCIVTIYDTWLQLRKEQTEAVLAKDIDNLCNLVQNIKGESEIDITQDERRSLTKMEGYSIFLEMELYKENLEQYLNRSEQNIPWANMVNDISRALQEVHEKGYVHCDVKPRNVFVDSTGSLYLGDFGSAKLKSGIGSSGLNRTCRYSGTTSCYNTDPLGPPRSVCFDIWSLGWLIVRIFSNDLSEFKSFFNCENHPEPVADFRSKLKLWSESGRLTIDAYSLIVGCLACDPRERLSAKDIVSMTAKLAASSPDIWDPPSPFMDTTND